MLGPVSLQRGLCKTLELLKSSMKPGPWPMAIGTSSLKSYTQATRKRSINKRANAQAPWTNEHDQSTSKQSPHPKDKQAWTPEQVSSTRDRGA